MSRPFHEKDKLLGQPHIFYVRCLNFIFWVKIYNQLTFFKQYVIHVTFYSLWVEGFFICLSSFLLGIKINVKLSKSPTFIYSMFYLAFYL